MRTDETSDPAVTDLDTEIYDPESPLPATEPPRTDSAIRLGARRRWVWVLASATILVGLISSLPTLGKALGHKPSRYRYRTARIMHGPIERVTNVGAELEATTVLPVRSLVSGVLMSVAVDRGAHVQKGQVLAVIDAERFKERLATAEERLAELRAGHQQLPTLDGTANATAHGHHHQVAEAEAALAAAQRELERSTIRSPVDGVLVSRAPRSGDSVSGGPDSPPLFLVFPKGGELTLHVVLDEDVARTVSVGQEMPVTVAGRRQRSVIVALDLTNTGERTMVVRLVSPSVDLLPGHTGHIRFVSDRLEHALRIPRNAVFAGTGEARPGSSAGFAWRLVHGTPEPVAVDLGLSNDEFVEVRGGLAAGDEVIDGIDWASTPTPRA
jgi:HlyD family secretion protein